MSLIATRYATALFALADKEKALDVVASELGTLATAIREDADVAKLLAHPLVSRAGKAEALAELLKTKKAHAVTQQGVERLAQAGRLPALVAVSEAFARMLDEARGIVNATVTSARPLSKKEEADIAKSLKEALGKDVQLTMKEDAALLGGLKIKVGSRELDMSMNGQLERMKRALLAA